MFPFRRIPVLLSLCSAIGVAGCGSSPHERRITQQEFGDRWPFSVAEGTLSCDTSHLPRKAVVFTSAAVSYGVNGGAKTVGYKPVDPIWRFATRQEQPDSVVARMSEQARRDAFRAIVECEDAATKAAEARHPQTDALNPEFDLQKLPALLQAQNDLSDRLTNRCKQKLRADSAISDEELRSIQVEGVLRQWPPLSRTRVNIGPVIEMGLELCK